MIKAFVWIGSNVLNHQPKVERAVACLEEVVGEQRAKLRILIEYQYCESFEFFTCFNQVDRVQSLKTPVPDRTQRAYFALQYQDYVRDETAQ